MSGRGSLVLMSLAIIAVVGTAVLVVVDQDPPEPQYDYEILIKTVDDLSPGDEITISYTDRYIEDSSVETDDANFLSELYVCKGEKVSSEVVLFNEKAISCDVYKYDILGATYTFDIDPNTGITYKWDCVSMGLLYEYVLYSTNLDLTKTAEEQVLTEGSYYNYRQYVPLSDQILYSSGNRQYSLTHYDSEQRMGIMRILSDLSFVTGSVTSTIDHFTYDDRIVVKESQSIQSRSEFLSKLDYDSLIAYYEECGYSITYGDSHTDVIDTALGTRKVTQLSITCSLDNELAHVDVSYGECGIIYRNNVRIVDEVEGEEGIIIGVSKESSVSLIESSNLMVTLNH